MSFLVDKTKLILYDSRQKSVLFCYLMKIIRKWKTAGSVGHKNITIYALRLGVCSLRITSSVYAVWKYAACLRAVLQNGGSFLPISRQGARVLSLLHFVLSSLSASYPVPKLHPFNWIEKSKRLPYCNICAQDLIIRNVVLNREMSRSPLQYLS